MTYPKVYSFLPKSTRTIGSSELAKRLGCSMHKIAWLRIYKGMPHHRVSAARFAYILEEIDEWMKRNPGVMR